MDLVRAPIKAPAVDRAAHLALAAVCIGAFAAILDTTVVGLVLSEIGRDLRVGIGALAWIPNAYILTYALLIAPSGILGDRLGRRRVFMGGVLVFTLGSVGCALAPTLGWLIAARVVQGAGTAAMLTLALALISVTFAARRQWAISMYVLVASSAGAVGPLFGGFLAQVGHWRWIFWAQLPLAATALLLARAGLKESRGADRPFDLVGLVGVSVGMVTLNLALLLGSRWGWLSWATTGTLTLSALSLAAFVWWERRTAAPMLRLHIFADRRFLVHTIGGTCAWFSLLAMVVYTSIYLLSDRGLHLLLAGLGAAVPSVGSAPIALTIDRVVKRWGAERVLLVAMGALTVTFAPWLWVRASWPVWLVVVFLGLAGAALSYVMSVSAAGALAQFPASEAGAASATFNTVRQIGSSLGVALPAVALTATLQGQSFTGTTGALDAPLAAAFAVRFLVVGAATLAVAVLLLQRPPQNS